MPNNQSGSSVSNEPLDHLIQSFKQDNIRLYEALKRIWNATQGVVPIFVEGICSVDLNPVTVTPTTPTGMSITIDDVGLWRVTATMCGRISFAGNGLAGDIQVNGVSKAFILLAISAAGAGDLTASCSRTIYHYNTGPSTVELKCFVGIAAGSRIVFAAGTSAISAEFLG